MSNFKYTPGDRHRRFFENFRVVLPETVEFLSDLKEINALYQEPDRYESPPYEGEPLPDRPERIVIFTSNASSHIQSAQTKAAFQPCRVEPIGALAAAIADKLLTQQEDTVTIGVYFRSGNGEFLDLRFDPVSLPDYDVRYQETIARYIDIARIVALRFPGKQVRYYVASDSKQFIDKMQAALDNVITLPDAGFDAPFGQYVASFGGDMKPLADAMVDIENLSRCDFLIYSPSLFPTFAVANSRTLDASNSYALSLTSVAKAIEPLAFKQKFSYLKQAFGRMPYFMFYPRGAMLRFHALTLRQFGETAQGEAMAHRAEVMMATNKITAVHYARAMFEQGNMADAEAALASSPEAANPFIMEFRAMVRAFQLDHGGACALLREAIRANPAITEPYVTLIRILLSRGALREAAAVATEGLRQVPDSNELLVQRVSILSAMCGNGGLVNVAGGKTCRQSSTSRWSFPGEAEAATNGVLVREFNFHTNEDNASWWRIDLGVAESVRRTVVFNRDNPRYQHLADGLLLQVSNDDQTWRVLGEAKERFSGSSGGQPWDLWFDEPPRVRYLRLQVPRRAYLHLQQIEVYAERSSLYPV